MPETQDVRTDDPEIDDLPTDNAGGIANLPTEDKGSDPTFSPETNAALELGAEARGQAQEVLEESETAIQDIQRIGNEIDALIARTGLPQQTTGDARPETAPEIAPTHLNEAVTERVPAPQPTGTATTPERTPPAQPQEAPLRQERETRSLTSEEQAELMLRVIEIMLRITETLIRLTEQLEQQRQQRAQQEADQGEEEDRQTQGNGTDTTDTNRTTDEPADTPPANDTDPSDQADTPPADDDAVEDTVSDTADTNLPATPAELPQPLRQQADEITGYDKTKERGGFIFYLRHLAGLTPSSEGEGRVNLGQLLSNFCSNPNRETATLLADAIDKTDLRGGETENFSHWISQRMFPLFYRDLWGRIGKVAREYQSYLDTEEEDRNHRALISSIHFLQDGAAEAQINKRSEEALGYVVRTALVGYGALVLWSSLGTMNILHAAAGAGNIAFWAYDIVRYKKYHQRKDWLIQSAEHISTQVLPGYREGPR